MKRSDFFRRLFVVPMVVALPEIKLDLEDDADFCNRLAVWAGNYVGRVGEHGHQSRAITDECFITYAWCFKDHNSKSKTLCEKNFKGLIYHLCETEKSRKVERRRKNNRQPVLYWRDKPEINKSGIDGFSIEKGFKRLRVRLLISKAQPLPEYTAINAISVEDDVRIMGGGKVYSIGNPKCNIHPSVFRDCKAGEKVRVRGV